jgi:hypothetical protein
VPQGPRVLVVDGVSDTEEVLRAVLAPRGVDVCRLSGTHLDARPSLVVIDSDLSDSTDDQSWAGVPKIILGRATRIDADDRHVFPRPFHYADLVRAIEQVIGDTN